MYFSTIELSKDDSLEMRKMLAMEGFSIYVVKEWDNRIDPVEMNCDCEIIYMDDTVRYRCIYNDATREVSKEVERMVKDSFRNKGCVKKFNFGAK